MRALVVVVALAACGVPMPVSDAGRDAGADAGVDAGPGCPDDGGERLVVFSWVSDQLGTICIRPECDARNYFKHWRTCQLRSIYADAGCGFRDDGGQVDIDCRALCGITRPSPECCDRLPVGAERQSCNWTPP